MLITFSENKALDLPSAVFTAAEQAGVLCSLTWSRVQSREVRFTLPGATTSQHESVILALLELDPRATIRTSRALYKGLQDYKRQHPAPELSTGQK